MLGAARMEGDRYSLKAPSRLGELELAAEHEPGGCALWRCARVRERVEQGGRVFRLARAFALEAGSEREIELHSAPYRREARLELLPLAGLGPPAGLLIHAGGFACRVPESLFFSGSRERDLELRADFVAWANALSAAARVPWSALRYSCGLEELRSPLLALECFTSLLCRLERRAQAADETAELRR